MEYWIVCDADGSELWRGSGSIGSSAFQQLPEGASLVVVPQAVIASATLNLDALRTALSIDIDNAAERVRARFITALPGQVGAYWMKAEAARRWLADSTASTVMLASEAHARGMTIADLAVEVIANAEAWAVVADAIEGVRFTAKARIAAAATIGAIAAAAVVDWESIHAPAA